MNLPMNSFAVLFHAFPLVPWRHLPPPLLALQGGGNPLLGLVPMVAVLAIFYVMMVLPMRKRQKALQQLIENLKKGDRVVTSGGLYGEIAAVTGGTVVLKIADNVRVKVAKSAITGLEGEPETGGTS